MQKKHKYCSYLILIVIFCGCSISPDFPIVPEIEYVGMSTKTMVQSNLLTDSLILTFKFRDGDGDIGNEPSSGEFDLIVTDNRTGNIFDRFKAPMVPEPGASNGIEGTIELKIYTTCCIFENNIPPCSSPVDFPTNEFDLSVQLFDRAMNASNIINTEFITLRCE